MIRLVAPARALAALFASLTLAACGGTVDFHIDKNLVIDSTVNSGTSTSSFDLAAEAGSAWKQRKHISSVSIQAATAAVTVVAPANTATSVSGQVWLLPEGVTTTGGAGTVKVGEWSDESVVVGNTIVLTPTPELNTFVRDAFNGSGKFSVYAAGAGASGARVAVTLHVVLDAKLKWKLP
jgi:hypothetical protein